MKHVKDSISSSMPGKNPPDVPSASRLWLIGVDVAPALHIAAVW